MADLLAKASAWLADQRARHMTQPVVYQRGADTIPVLATIGTTIFRIEDGAGALLRVESRDYLITAATLVLGGTTLVPKRGDRLRETQGSRVFIYEVSAPGDEPEWRWSDPYRTTLRIHTQQMDTQ